MKTKQPHVATPPERIRWPLQPWQRELIFDVWEYLVVHDMVHGHAEELLAELLNHLPEIKFDPRRTITVIHYCSGWPYAFEFSRKLPDRPIGLVFHELKTIELFCSDLLCLIHRAQRAAEDVQ